MSSGEVRRVSRQDIQLVQNLIERCLQLYMNQKEVVHTLLVQAKIEPGFTELVWQKLEEENREFFKAYNIRLMLKHQITIFNELLEKQVELMDKIGPAGVVSLPIISNGSHTSALHQTAPRYIPEHTVPPKAENLHHQIRPNPPTLLNGALPLHRVMYATDDISLLTGRMDISPNMLSAQNSQMGMMQGMNGNVIKPEPGYSNNSSFAFGATIGDASVASFSSIDSNSQQLHEPLMDNDISSYGFLGQIPRNFSLSDLTADFSQSSDILESYSRSPYLATDSDNFLDSQGRFECQGDKRLDTISEGLSYEEFGSD